MGFGALRTIIRPLSRTILSRPPPASVTTSSLSSSLCPKPGFSSFLGGSFYRQSPWIPISNQLHSLTDTRLPKRRPQDKPRRKRASLKPPGPYAWVKYTPGEPILPNNPNEGSVKRRNEKKRMRLRRAFKLAEAKKRKAQLQEANRKKKIKRVERKMAAVARERAWAERLVELQRLEEEKKKAVA
ncbi:PREDICTED: uncharacterized protein LOC18610842 [Theobroma cacao]|uniref:Uncharacterized protein LOC18610842 n=1 Tax=Theobroma cacao TaxID=3641 RepID=A0AB32W2F4_THECC|nr:PREDICTED: uncharacterized protein LOC18610842 [Theobroma cacao]